MDDIFVHHSPQCLHIEKWERMNPHLRAGFTTRRGGVSTPPFATMNLGLNIPDDRNDVVENRQHLAERLSIPLENWVSGEQIHGNHVCIVNQKDRGKGSHCYQTSIPGVDGFITNETDILCTAFFSYCVPLFFYDYKTHYIGVAHAGWKGTVSRIAEKMVRTLSSKGVDPANLFVVIGPAISQKNYEVDEQVIDHVDQSLQERTVIQKENDRFLLDLKQLNVDILLQCGVIRSNIEVSNYCTYTDKEMFFSHRRDAGKTGRMLAFIGYTT